MLPRAKKMVTQLLPAPLKHRLALLRDRWSYVPPVEVADPGRIEASPFASWVATPNLLTELGERYRPTKRYHNYLPFYWVHFRDIREHVRSVIEIGVQTDRSVRMWSEFFPNATIYGIDVNPACASFESDRVRIFIGSQADPAFLDRCLQQIGRAPDVVIDDGSHRPEHQIATFNHLFPRLSSHGIYAIEDTGGVADDAALRTVHRLTPIIDQLFFWPSGRAHWTTLHEFGPEASWLAKHVAGVAFYRSIVFVMRGANPSDNPYLPLDNETIQREGLGPLLAVRPTSDPPRADG